MAADEIRYLVFDVESASDGQLVSDVRYPGEQLDAQAALANIAQNASRPPAVRSSPTPINSRSRLWWPRSTRTFNWSTSWRWMNPIPLAYHDRVFLARLGTIRAADAGEL